MNEIERDYYAERARTEWRLSETTADPFAAQVHAALAERYDALIARFDKPTRIAIARSRA